MARPLKDGMSYFPHDVDAASDEKIEILMANYGSKGYAFYFFMLERIYRNPKFELVVTDAETRQLFANKLSITLQEFNNILETSLKFGAFCKKTFEERGVLTSDGIKKRAEIVIKKRFSMRKTVTGELLPQEHHQKLHKVKESKVKESKVNSTVQQQQKTNLIQDAFDNQDTILPVLDLKEDIYTLENCLDSGLMAGLTEEQSTEFYHHYAAQGWKLGNGMPISNIKSAMNRWKTRGFKFENGQAGQKKKQNNHTCYRCGGNIGEDGQVRKVMLWKEDKPWCTLTCFEKWRREGKPNYESRAG